MHYLDIKVEGIDENGNSKSYKLADFNGKNIILYFYPQDDTPVCTQEAENFRDEMNELKEHAVVIGVSSDDINSHIDFQKKHKLNFIMLADKLNELKNAFKEHTKGVTNIHRATFILDKNGDIVKVWEKVDINDHIEEIKEFFKIKN